MLSRLKIGVLAVVATLLAIGGSGIATVTAQDASPVAMECVSPGLPPGTPTPMDEGMEGMDMASPEAMDEMASPEAMEMPEMPPAPVGTPAEGETLAAVEAAAANYAACVNQGWATGDPSLYVALESANFIMNSTGTGNPYDRVAGEMGGPFTSFEVTDITNEQVFDDGRVGANIHGLINGTFIVNILAVFVEEDGTWKYDEEFFQSPDTSFASGVTVMGIDIIETTDEATGQVTYAFQFLGAPTAVQNEVITLNVTNKGVEAHEALVMVLPEGADPMGLLDESVSFDDVQFVGFAAPIFPGETAEMAFLNLEPGVYTIVCFFPGPDGTPHIVNGMVAQFEVTAAA
ncbi:MAG: hypothetical protein AB7V46_25770 [Thermomicrobiales bacterium]